MFIFTARLNKKLVFASAVLLLAVIALLIFFRLSGKETEETSAIVSMIKTNEDRVEYLRQCGWQVAEKPIETQEIVIPRSFEGAYSDYLALQKAQGFELDNYSGLDAVRYTYEIENYPDGTDNVVADLIVCRGIVIAGDVQSPALDGFMHGLRSESGKTL